MNDKPSSASLAGRWISKAMALAGLNQAALAKKMGISASSVNRLVNGKRGSPTIETVAKVLGFCGYEIVELRVKREKEGNS